MQVTIFPDYEMLSEQSAGEVISLIQQKPDAVICIASGSTPVGTCQSIVKKATEQRIDFSKVCFIGLDEWVGIPPENEGSCFYFQHHYLFEPLQLAASQTVLFNALASDLKAECKKMDALIEEKGGIDLMIVGIGMNGHIGFNEPGTSFSSMCHVTALDDTTKTVGQKYFKEKILLDSGITLGLGHLLNAKKVLLQANGQHKAGVIKTAVQGLVTEDFPASVMQLHNNGFVLVDEAAAASLK